MATARLRAFTDSAPTYEAPHAPVPGTILDAVGTVIHRTKKNLALMVLIAIYEVDSRCGGMKE